MKACKIGHKIMKISEFERRVSIKNDDLYCAVSRD